MTRLLRKQVPWVIKTPVPADLPVSVEWTVENFFNGTRELLDTRQVSDLSGRPWKTPI